MNRDKSAASAASRAIPRRSGLVTWVGVPQAGEIEAILRDDFVAVFNQVLQKRTPAEATAAFDNLRSGLGLEAADFRSIHGTETDAYEIVAAAERISNSGRELSFRTLESEVRPSSPTAGRIADDGIRNIFSEAGRAYRNRYGAGPDLQEDPDLFARAGRSYLYAVALHTTAGESAIGLDESGKERFKQFYDELRSAAYIVGERRTANQHFRDQSSGAGAAFGVGTLIGSGLLLSSLHANPYVALAIATTLGLVSGVVTPVARFVTGRRLGAAQHNAMSKRDTFARMAAEAERRSAPKRR